MNRKYYTRHVLYGDGRVEELKVPKKAVDKEISERLKEDRVMLKILEKL